MLFGYASSATSSSSSPFPLESAISANYEPIDLITGCKERCKWTTVQMQQQIVSDRSSSCCCCTWCTRIVHVLCFWAQFSERSERVRYARYETRTKRSVQPCIKRLQTSYKSFVFYSRFIAACNCDSGSCSTNLSLHPHPD
jgi:hypothetical protein